MTPHLNRPHPRHWRPHSPRQPERRGGEQEAAPTIGAQPICEIAQQKQLAQRNAEFEQAEMVVLQAYLPARMSAEEVTAAVQAIVASLGASGPGDMGKVMGAVKTQLAGKADMGQVSAAVKAALAG